VAMYKSLLFLTAMTLFCVSLNAQTSSDSGANVPIKPVRVSWGVVAGNVNSHVMPQYPEGAIKNHISGTVLFAMHIGKDGEVLDVKPVHGNPIFSSATKDALSQWTFRPYKLNGAPVDVETQVSCTFTSKEEKIAGSFCHAEY